MEICWGPYRMALTSMQSPTSILEGRSPAQTCAASGSRSSPAAALRGRCLYDQAPSHAPEPFSSPGSPAGAHAPTSTPPGSWQPPGSQAVTERKGPGRGLRHSAPRGVSSVSGADSPAPCPTCPALGELLPAIAKSPAARRAQVERAGPPVAFWDMKSSRGARAMLGSEVRDRVAA